MQYNKLAGWKLAVAICTAMIIRWKQPSFFDQKSRYTSLKTDEPEKVYEMMDTFSSWTLLDPRFDWIGYRSGNNYIMHSRHVRSDRLGRLNAETRLQLAHMEKENRRLQDELQLSEVGVAELVRFVSLGGI